MATIHQLAGAGDTAGMRRELRKLTQVDLRDEEDFTALARAAAGPASNIPAMQLLVEHGANVNARVDHGHSCVLMVAARTGYTENVKFLLDAGADIRLQVKNAYSVLVHVAHKLCFSPALVPMLKFLIDAGADVDAASSYGESTLSTTSYCNRFDAVKLLLDAGANPTPLAWDRLMKAAAIGSIDETRTALQQPDCDPFQLDRSGRSAWHLSVICGDLDKVKCLHDFGFDLEMQSRHGMTALAYAAANGHVDVLLWLIGAGADVDSVANDGSTPLMAACSGGHVACVRRLLEAGANPQVVNKCRERAISMAVDEETVELLVSTGQEIHHVSGDMKRQLLGLTDSRLQGIDERQAINGCQRIFGRSNPELMEIPFWHAMVRSGATAYQAQAAFGEDKLACPTWCFDRFGMSLTRLPDGRYVQIGGEHEDFYDSNFCIYNEVVVHERSGRFQIFGYPEELFPPTDFHSATFLNGCIYVIGNLGYRGSRAFGTTPVYRLNCQNWSMEPLDTTGENPGWISGHKCQAANDNTLVLTGGSILFAADGSEQRTRNADEFHLDLDRLRWRRLDQTT